MYFSTPQNGLAYQEKLVIEIIFVEQAIHALNNN